MRFPAFFADSLPQKTVRFPALHPVCAPWTLFERRNRLICRQRAAQPVFRVLAAAHLVVARKAQADQPPVVPPEAELVCQRLKFCPLLARAVEILKRILEDLQSDGICLSLLCHTEIRRQIAQRAIPAEHRRAESMDRRNLRQMDSGKLALQVPIQGIFRKAPGKLGADFAAQLACRRLRIGNNQKLVDICRVVFVLHIGSAGRPAPSSCPSLPPQRRAARRRGFLPPPVAPG